MGVITLLRVVAVVAILGVAGIFAVWQSHHAILHAEGSETIFVSISGYRVSYEDAG